MFSCIDTICKTCLALAFNLVVRVKSSSFHIDVQLSYRCALIVLIWMIKTISLMYRSLFASVNPTTPTRSNMSSLSRHQLRQHDRQIRRDTMQDIQLGKMIYCAVSWNVIIRTMAGTQCCPAGLGEGDFRLTCPPHLLVSDILSMKDWIRFSTEDDRRRQREVGHQETWWQPLEIKVEALICGQGSESWIAPRDFPIGYSGSHVTAVSTLSSQSDSAWVWDKPVDATLLESVRTPPTPRR